MLFLVGGAGLIAYMLLSRKKSGEFDVAAFDRNTNEELARLAASEPDTYQAVIRMINAPGSFTRSEILEGAQEMSDKGYLHLATLLSGRQSYAMAG